MDVLDIWRLCDELSVVQAALLIAGEDPSVSGAYVEGWDMGKRPEGYEAAKTAIMNAVAGKRLPGKIKYPVRMPYNYKDEPTEEENLEYDKDGNHVYVQKQPDPAATLVQVDDLRKWLASRGMKSGFFFSGEEGSPDYLNEDHSNYSPKLAAAIEAWLAVTNNPELTKAKSVKQALLVWLRSQAGRFDLIKDDGNPNESGIEEVAKVANWETKGGAPKTP